MRVASPMDDPESSLSKAQQAQLLRKAFAGLSDGCRELLGWRYDEDLSYQEIARRIGVKEGHYGFDCRDALRRLRGYIPGWNLQLRDADE